MYSTIDWSARSSVQTGVKMLSVIVVGVLAFSLAGCGRNESDSSRVGIEANENMVSQELAGIGETDSESLPKNKVAESGQSELESSMAEQDTAEPESSAVAELETEPAADGSNALVVYFSWLGNTENVANAIVNQTGADVFEIVPVRPLHRSAPAEGAVCQIQ